ncbi:MAG: biopolymer transporter ExbD [Planctomycetales bacterium]|nr:biopolymer transporter ExbD [Planctomycetales bacterium]
MLKTPGKKQFLEAASFDMTPVIDVVFQLIIFFMLVSQFIAAEQFKVRVPDQIKTARQQEAVEKVPLTITVLPAPEGKVRCAVGDEKLAPLQGKDLTRLICSAVDESLTRHPASGNTVRLRCDKSIAFGQVKYILSGIAQSRAENLDWAVQSE